MAEQLTPTAFSQLEETSMSDLLLAIVGSNERALTSSLLGLLDESARYAAILDATGSPIRRQKLARLTHIDTTNISKVTGPLVRSGWLRAAADAEGIIYRRSSVVDALLRGRTILQWQTVVRRRLGDVSQSR